MAAVTVNSTKYTVLGNIRSTFYNIAGNTGDTLVSGLSSIKQIIFDPGVVTAAAATPAANGMSTITFTASGPFTATNVQVIGY